MNQTRLRQPAALVLLWLTVALLTLSTATYAWITNSNNATDVTPMSGTIASGSDLLISNDPNGEFNQQCALLLRGNADDVKPVSTADLTAFFAAAQQDNQGMAVLFEDVSAQIDRRTICGTVYLKSENERCNVYLSADGLYFGNDPQALAAMRLGLRVSTGSGTQTYILRLDEMGNTGGAQSARTVEQTGVVVSAVDGQKRPTLVNDPSTPISTYFYREGSQDPLCILDNGEIGTVDYWLYLEGCDDQCVNAAQSRDIALQLAFTDANPAESDGR